MAKEEFSKSDYTEASTLFHSAKRQVLNRTSESASVNELAKKVARIKGAYANTLKSNSIKTINGLKNELIKTVAEIKKAGNTEIIGYREKILAAIKDVELKEKIKKISYPQV